MRISDWSSDVCSSDLACVRQRCNRHSLASPEAVAAPASRNSVRLRAAPAHCEATRTSSRCGGSKCCLGLERVRPGLGRPEERREGKECVRKCSSRRCSENQNKNNQLKSNKTQKIPN